MSVVLVDWLGRGGIAQCSQVWAAELRGLGAEVVVVTRPGRDLQNTFDSTSVTPPGGHGRLGAHRRLIARAALVIRRERPDVVVIQNYLIPVLEHQVVAVAEEVGAEIVIVVHDHRMHTWRAGTHVGLRRSLRRASILVAHSCFVADRVSSFAGREVVVIPHPRVVGALPTAESDELLSPGTPGDRLALHFGIVHRTYKGTDTVVEMASQGLPGWRFACVGAGAPQASANLATVARFLTEGELATVVAASDATLLPYRHASQSGAVVLAQSLGSVPIASAVGGIPEQIRHGETGLLVRSAAPASEWLDLLRELDGSDLQRMSAAGSAWVNESHGRFIVALRGIYRGPAP